MTEEHKESLRIMECQGNARRIHCLAQMYEQLAKICDLERADIPEALWPYYKDIGKSIWLAQMVEAENMLSQKLEHKYL